MSHRLRFSATPYLVACTGIAFFCAMDATMKGLSMAIGVYNAMLWRMLAGAIIGGIIFFARHSPWPTGSALRLHWLRSAVVTVMAMAFFWGIVRVPLAEGIALTFVAPLIALYLAALLLRERIETGAIIASLLGLAGVLTIVAAKLRLNHEREALLGIAALVFSAVLYAYNLILQRQQALIAAPLEIAFCQNLFVLVFLVLLAPFLAVVPSPDHLPAILGSAAMAFIALFLLAWAYARAEAQVLVTVEYSAFIWAALLGWIFFDEQLTGATLAGAALIVTGCTIAARRKRGAPVHVETAAL
jgi:S-adenosylmethionine uptake transporter